jgi:hypothetical protein
VTDGAFALQVVPMDLSAAQIHDFGVALNEASLVGLEVEAAEGWAGVTLSALSLPPDGGPEPADPRIQLVLQPIGRIAASLRQGAWDDDEAAVAPLGLERLHAAVAGFGQQPIYGWEFLDVPEEKNFARWRDRLSLDWHGTGAGLAHTLDLFQESGTGERRHLDLRLWFDELRIFGPDRAEIAFDDFTAGGVRWWDAMYAGDERTKGHGIVPTRRGER